ncbi:two-component sensor histidine kinase [Microbacterium murale]|uniref:histidine kinase n=1 Tax=Microbacterium murale TaxID=1081040 RepID=A0ABQ1S090_9MICO|nr:two-component sensor histidine kinase [Microbacterium murale]
MRARIPGWARDLIAAAVVLVTSFGPLMRFTDGLSPVGWIVVGLPVALMFVRRRYPWAVLVACVACFVVVSLTLMLTPFSALPTGLAVFTIATRTNRRTIVITVLCVLAVMIPASVFHEWASLHPLTMLVLVMVGFFAAAGDAIRSRRAYIDEITQRAVQAEQTREAEASRRVAEDRLRIARDLHDTVAHQISVINLHAAVASRAIDDDPDAAKSALTTVSTASRRVLSEIGDLLSTLRAPDESQSLVPTPGLGMVGALIDEFEASGLHVTARIEGELTDLPAAVDLAGYRLVQEALTNAHKHGSVPRAHVWIEREEGALRLVITNPTSSNASAGEASAGHGLLGIRERVTGVGGSLSTGRDGGTFRVDAFIPLAVEVPQAPA